MLLNAVDDWNIDIQNSYMIGDRNSDVEAGNRAGVKQSVLIKQNEPFALLNAVKNLI